MSRERTAEGAGPGIPANSRELTVAWFNATVAPALGGTIADVVVNVIGTDVGFVGEIYRCALQWQNDAAGLPASVIVKLPAEDGRNRDVGEGMQVYEREIEVYRKLSGKLGVQMPAYIYSDFDPDPAPWLERVLLGLFDRLPVGGVDWVLRQFLKASGKSKRRYVLVLEDVADARPPQQVDGGSVGDVERGLVELAAFHATNWMSAEAVATSQRFWPLDRAPKVFQATYRRNRDAFLEAHPGLYPRDLLDRLDALQDELGVETARLCAAPWTLLHGDFRIDNLLYRPNGDTVVLDYQIVGWGRPGFDVAYFISTALDPSHRHAEQRLLGQYHQALTAHGVTDYPLATLNQDVERTKLLLAHRMVSAFDGLDTEMAEHERSLADIMATRVAGWTV